MTTSYPVDEDPEVAPPLPDAATPTLTVTFADLPEEPFPFLAFRPDRFNESIPVNAQFFQLTINCASANAQQSGCLGLVPPSPFESLSDSFAIHLRPFIVREKK